MNKRLRPIPYPPGSPQRRWYVAYLREAFAMTRQEALAKVSTVNQLARHTPLPGETCGAQTRKGTPCRCRAGANGRCKYHGGMSTGPKTVEGKKTVARNLTKTTR